MCYFYLFLSILVHENVVNGCLFYCRFAVGCRCVAPSVAALLAVAVLRPRNLASHSPTRNSLQCQGFSAKGNNRAGDSKVAVAEIEPKHGVQMPKSSKST